MPFVDGYRTIAKTPLTPMHFHRTLTGAASLTRNLTTERFPKSLFCRGFGVSARKKPHYEDRKAASMEAAGIEPASCESLLKPLRV